MNASPPSDAPPLLRSPLWPHSLRLLLVQARNAPRMIKQEQQCFAERCRVPIDRFRVVNVAQGDRPSPDHLADVDAVLIGGAGKFSAAEDYAWTDPLLDFVRHVVHEQVPLFGSCWGHQVIARALGGTVQYDPDHAELGCWEVTLTAAGQNDPLFHRFPRRFYANMGHHDRVTDLPAGAVELAQNEQPYQAFRLRNAPVYGTQFHSELDAKRERERILVYRKHYREALPDKETVQKVINNLAATTEVDHLLYDFLTTFVVRGRPLEHAVSLERPSSFPSSRLSIEPNPPPKRHPESD